MTAGGYKLFRGFLALLHKFLDHLLDVCIRDFLGAALRGFEEKDLFLDGAGGIHCHSILGLHCGLDVFLNLLFECHIACNNLFQTIFNLPFNELPAGGDDDLYFGNESGR